MPGLTVRAFSLAEMMLTSLLTLSLLLCAGCGSDSASGADVKVGTDAVADTVAGMDVLPETIADSSGPVPYTFAPGEELIRKEIADPAQPVLVRVSEQFEVSLPAGTLAQPGTLVVTGGPTPTDDERPWEPLDSYDVKLLVNGEAVQPLQPLVVRFKVYPARLRAGMSLWEQVIVARYDEDVGYWSELPFRIETEAGAPASIADDPATLWIATTSWTLSAFTDMLIKMGWSVLTFPRSPGPGWRIYFDPKTPLSPIFGAGAQGIVKVATLVRDELDKGVAGILGLGLDNPALEPTNWTLVTCYLTYGTGGMLYKGLEGSIRIDIALNDDNEARHELTHELVHLFQNAKLWSWSMAARRWFVEAEADYIADAVTKGGRLVENMKPDYLRKALSLTDGKHEYATAYVVKWIADRGVPVKSLQDAVFNAESDQFDSQQAFLKTAFDATVANGSCTNMVDKWHSTPCTEQGEILARFAWWLIADPSSPLAGNSVLEVWAESKKTLAADAASVSLSSFSPHAQVALVSAVTIEGEAGKKRSIYVYGKPGTNCFARPFVLPQGKLDGAREIGLWKKDFDFPGPGAADQVDPGDVVMILQTSNSQKELCWPQVEVRQVPFCEQSNESGSGAGLSCKDADGTYKTAGSTCDGTILKYDFYTCEMWTGTPGYTPMTKCKHVTGEKDCNNYEMGTFTCEPVDIGTKAWCK